MKQNTKDYYHQRIRTVLLYIQRHLDDDLSLETLSRLAHWSPLHFHRIFKGMIGETVTEHIRRIRLERAAHQLAAGKENVTNTAFGAGYETLEAFSRAFKRSFGCPPSKYKEHHRRILNEKFPGMIHYSPGGTKLDPTIQHRRKSTMEVTMKTLEPLRIAFVRHTGPYNECEAAWSTLFNWAASLELLGPDTQFLGIGYDDPVVTPPDKIRYDACISVGEDITANGEIGIQTLGGGKYAVTIHNGSYDGLEATYAQLMGQWLPESGLELGDNPCFERYLNDPRETPPEELLTAIHISIK